MGDKTHQLAADIIETALTGGLTHPGNPATKQQPAAIPLPMFRTTGMPDAMAANVRATARLISEAIVHALHSDGRIKIAPAELEPEQPQPVRTTPTVAIQCPHGHGIVEVVAKPVVRLHAGQLKAIAEAAQCRH